MKKTVPVVLMMFPFVSVADMSLDLRNQMLDSEIAKYTQIRDEKYAALKQCEKTTKGFKIAGLTTLVATGVGVYVNVKLEQKLKSKSSGGGKSARVVDNRPQEEKNDDSCKVLCDVGAAPPECSC
ncbi:MAG: hypothetical protein IK122_03520 [Alphaproteobacteria bacterium]|nr:hypothetical protein [Alphaproteobacteria bacterium]